MSNESSAEIAAARRDWKTGHLEMYLSSGGVQGYVMDLRDIGGHRFTTHCLIRKVWDLMTGVFPPYEKYQASTAREIPLVMMSAQESIPVFSA